MNKRERRQLKRAAREAAAQAQTTPDVEATATVEGAGTLEEANSKLSEAAKVINMKQAKEKAEKKKGAAKAGGGKKSALSVKALPPLPKKAGARKPKPEVDCECGCGGKTKSRFVPGHDSYLRGLVIRVDREVMTLADVEKLGGKGQRVAVEKHLAEFRKQQKAKAKEERAAEKAENAGA